MAEEFQRSRLNTYAATSNLVLTAERDPSHQRKERGKDEVATLKGRLDSTRMGDRTGGNDAELNNRIKKAQLKRQIAETSGESGVMGKKRKGQSTRRATVLSMTDDLDAVSYRPKTRESRAAYDELMTFIKVSIGDQPHDILCGAADEILSLLKDDRLRDSNKLNEIQKILNKISDTNFNKLVSIGKCINDFNVDENADADDRRGKVDEDGIAVVFDDEDEDYETGHILAAIRHRDTFTQSKDWHVVEQLRR